jgi:arylsulfatase A-like enzyme
MGGSRIMQNRRSFPNFVALGVSCRSLVCRTAQALVLAVVLSGTLSPASAADALPNVVMFLVDDMGVMDTSLPFLTDAQGRPKRYPLNDFFRTPNMERLAAGGIRFNDFAAMSVCSPTRLSLMTGQNAARHRTTNWINPDRDNAGPRGAPQWNWRGLQRGDVTLAGLLQSAGYRTIHVGKGHFGPRDSEGAEPLNLGFCINVGGASFGAPGSYYGQDNYGLGTKRAASAVPHLEKYHGTETHLSEALTIEANAHVRQAVEAGRPFFLYLSHYAVHSPFQSDPRFAAHYVDSGKPAPAQAFATLVEGIDKSLGDVLDQIEALGVADNTLVLFLGDNGTDAPLGHQHEVACAAPLRGKKGAHYEGGTRTPLIVAWARPNPQHPHQQRLPIARAAIQSQMANVCDLFPTLLALTGIQTPADHPVDGQRLDTLLTGRADDARHDVFLMHYPHGPHRSEYFTVYREGPWKVIYHYLPSEVSDHRHYQLFHLGEDPFEQRDLVDSHPEELRRRMQALIAALQAHDAVYPVAEDGVTALRPKMP